MVAWNEETETKAIKSISNINIGEEITVNYDWQELNMKVHTYVVFCLCICKSVLQLQKAHFFYRISMIANRTFQKIGDSHVTVNYARYVCIFIQW